LPLHAPERLAPPAAEPLELVRPDPRMRAGALALLVGPPRDGACAFGVIGKPGCVAQGGKLPGALDMRVIPALDVPRVREEVAFFRVAAAVGEHEVVAEIGRVPRPGDEVIDVAAAANLPSAIE